MADNANLLSTPEGYATPDQIKSTYDYAKALLSGSGQQPIHHWTQGVSNMVSALVGGQLDYNAGQKQNMADAVRAGRMLPNVGPVPGQPGVSGQTSFNEGPASAGQTNAGGDASNAISGIESGGRYDLKGPVTKSGDRAYGKYQVMGANIPEWTQAAFGKRMTPDEFLNNPQAQEALFKQKFGEYTQKYGPEGAAKAWFAGEGGMNDPNRKDQLGTTVASYAQQFDKAYGGNPAVGAMTNALRGGVQDATARPKMAQNTEPLPSGGQIYIDPSLVQRRPQYNEGQMRGILADPTISEQTKLQLLGQYQNQNAPIDVPVAGGTVRINPLNPRQQQFIPELQKGTAKLGDMEHPTYNTVGPNPLGQPPGLQQTPANIQQNPAVGPRSEAAPAAKPAAAPTGAPAPAPTPVVATSQNAPAAPATPSKGVQVASLDPTAGVAEAGKAVEKSEPVKGGYEHLNPATGKVEKTSDEEKPADTPLAKFAQAGLPPGSSPTPVGNTGDGGLHLSGFSAADTEDYARKKQFDVQRQLDEEAGKKNIDLAMKKYDTLSTQAQSARKQLPNIDYALALMNDKNFYSGLGANEVTAWNKLKAALPSIFGQDAAFAAAPNEVFNKVVSGSILDNMKTALGGLGQVRLAEIELLKQANASNQNTPAANRALLEVSRRAATSIDHLDEMGQAYISGDEVVDPVDGKTLLKANVDRNGEIQPRRGLDAGYDKLARQYALSHPTLTKEDAARYKEIFKTGIDPNEPAPPAQAAPAVGGTPQKGAIQEFDDGKGGKVKGQWDGTQWGPVK